MKEKELNELQQLLETRSYEVLSSNEKELVKKYISEQKYIAMKKLIENGTLVFQNELEDSGFRPELGNKLRESFLIKKQKERVSAIQILLAGLNFRIRLAHALLAVGLILLGTIYLVDEKPAEQTEKVVYVNHTDTVYVEVEKVVPEEITKYLTVYRDRPQPHQATSYDYSNVKHGFQAMNLGSSDGQELAPDQSSFSLNNLKNMEEQQAGLSNNEDNLSTLFGRLKE